MGGGGRAAPFWGDNELKKTGARSARARTRGQNPLVLDNSLIFLRLYSNPLFAPIIYLLFLKTLTQTLLQTPISVIGRFS